MEYVANGRRYTYEASGARLWGDDVVLLSNANDITKKLSWHDKGFSIDKLFESSLYKEFISETQRLLVGLWRDAGLNLPENFNLEQYHTLVQDFDTHVRAVNKTKLLSVEKFPVAINLLEERISSICSTPLIVCNPFDGQRVFHFRVIRPNSSDNNPLHRDIWLEDYDDCINLYIPIAGSNPQTSLMIVPGSHVWPESRIERTERGAEINGVKFNVPAVTAIQGDFTVERPSPGENEVLVFSPYLIHGGAINASKDQTRISIEIRLWKR